ncbi:MAG: ribonuclease P protein component [Chitinophagales bacterium]
MHAEEHAEERNSAFHPRRDLSSSSRLAYAQFDLSKLKGKTTFCAAEKLKSQKLIEQLFKEGKSVSHNGFTLVYLFGPLSTHYPALAGFSVPKKSFKHAVDRNRIKRLLREAYRHQKFALYQKLVADKKQACLMWVYKGKELPEYDKVVKEVQFCLKKLL